MKKYLCLLLSVAALIMMVISNPFIDKVKVVDTVIIAPEPVIIKPIAAIDVEIEEVSEFTVKENIVTLTYKVKSTGYKTATGCSGYCNLILSNGGAPEITRVSFIQSFSDTERTNTITANIGGSDSKNMTYEIWITNQS